MSNASIRKTQVCSFFSRLATKFGGSDYFSCTMPAEECGYQEALRGIFGARCQTPCGMTNALTSVGCTCASDIRG